MARPTKQGIDYFPLDIDIENDDKLQLIEAKYSLIGFACVIKLFCKIYRNGYYYNWNEKEQLLFGKQNNLEIDVCNNIVNDCINYGIFDKNLFNVCNILTSIGIQRRFFEAIKRREKVEIHKEFALIDVSAYNNLIIVDNNSINVNNSTQSKVKKSKVKKSKENILSPIGDGVQIDFISELLNIFCEEFTISRGLDFELTNKGKEREAIGRLLGSYKAKHKEAPKTSEETKQHFRNLFKKCLEISDKWHYERMSPCHIGSEINTLLTIIKGKNNGTNTGTFEVHKPTWL